MFTSVSIYFLMSFLIFWAYCGYLISIYLLSLFGKKKDNQQKIGSFPEVTILVPCYNEENLVKAKVKNLVKLDYPKSKLKVVFLDGGSEDKTLENLKKESQDLPYIKAVTTDSRGKINQLNFYLAQVQSEIVISTDMDALLNKNVVKEFIKVFQSDPQTGVVGARVVPKNCSKLEARYWDDQNILRILESEVHSSSIVIAPCYAFRRDLLLFFPHDCIADDIYISFLANSRGYKVKYIPSAVVYETRTPKNLHDLITHKFRKGNAYEIELLRFLYTMPRMQPRWKLIFLTKFLQVIIMPWILTFFALSSISLILSGSAYLKIVLFNTILLFLSLVVTSFLMSQKRKRFAKGKSKGPNLSIFLVTNFILLLNGLTFPFYHQTSNYPKVK